MLYSSTKEEVDEELKIIKNKESDALQDFSFQKKKDTINQSSLRSTLPPFFPYFLFFVS